MAYISTQEVKEIRNNLKKEFPNLKFSVKREHFSKIVVSIIEGNIDFGFNYKNIQYVKNPICEKIVAIVNQKNYDNSNIMEDYFDCGYYVDIFVGNYDKDYKLIK